MAERKPPGGQSVSVQLLKVREKSQNAAVEHHMSSRPKVSVVIPVHNSGPYLRRCLDSVLGQSLRSIEVVCVNDTSVDDSPAILREYESKDGRVKVIDFSDRQGAAVARNTAMAEARGEYLGFVDSDDEVDLDFYEKLHDRAAETGAAIVKGDFLEITEDGRRKPRFINDRIRNDRFRFNCQFTAAIYSAEHIRKSAVDFPAGVTIGEDLAFLVKAVSVAPGVETVDGVFYRYHRRTGSTNIKNLSRAKIMSVLRALGDALGFINRHEIGGRQRVRIYVSLILWVIQRLPGLRRFRN
jgi:glycosyltransferase involved in cell wall biosynthesis